MELLTNVARTLAKLTLHDKAAEALAKSDVPWIFLAMAQTTDYGLGWEKDMAFLLGILQKR